MKLKQIMATVLTCALAFTCASCNKTNTEESKPTTESKSETESKKSDTYYIPETPEIYHPEAELLEEPYMTTCDGSAKVTIKDNKFMVGDKELWLNGAITPWDRMNQFGYKFNLEFWQEHFAELHESGFNVCRIWISSIGDLTTVISEDGDIEGAEYFHWKDLDTFFNLAEEYQIYTIATVQTFDHYQKDNLSETSTYKDWRALMRSPEKTDTYVDNYLVPLVQRYDSCDYLLAVDLFNEPDHLFESSKYGKLNWQDMEQYFAKASAAIHANSDVLVTAGMGSIKYNSDKPNGNVISDSRLQSINIGKYDSSLAYMDFWSTHWYQSMIPDYGIIYDMTPAEYKFDTSKPVVISEIQSKGYEEKYNYKFADVCEKAYNNGYQGVFGWKSCGDDDEFGDSSLCFLAADYMMTIHPEKIFPNGKKITPTQKAEDTSSSA
jgi:hypothetical protein